MPSRRSQPPPEPQRPPRVRKTHEETRTLLQRQIDKGKEIAAKIDPGAYMPDTYDLLENEVSRWSSYNYDLLRTLFDTDEVAKSYSIFGMFGIGSSYDNYYKKMARMRSVVDDRVNFLQGEIEKLEIYESVPESGWPEVATFGGATPQNWPKRPAPAQPIIHITNSTFGTLNTGDVLGSINSHVSTVTGQSAEDFRAAITEFARAVDQNSHLPEEGRRTVLESIDVVAEEANRPPEKRRLRAVHALLAAVPGTIAVSGGAIEAWDRYGPTIRAYLGL